jgi:hypothetical protein
MTSPSAAGNNGFTYRSPLAVILLTLVTCGIYSFYWVYQLGREMQQHNGSGLGPVVNLLLWLLSGLTGGVTGIVLLFTLPNDVKATYERDGRSTDISALTGFWNLLPLIGWIVWVVKVQSRLNNLWVETEGVSPA